MINARILSYLCTTMLQNPGWKAKPGQVLARANDDFTEGACCILGVMLLGVSRIDPATRDYEYHKLIAEEYTLATPFVCGLESGFEEWDEKSRYATQQEFIDGFETGRTFRLWAISKGLFEEKQDRFV